MLSNWTYYKDKILLTPELCFTWLLINWRTFFKNVETLAERQIKRLVNLAVITCHYRNSKWLWLHAKKKKKKDK